MKFSNFAERYQRQSGTVQLMNDLGRARSASGPVYMLGGGNPAHIPAVDEIMQDSLTQLVNDSTVFGRMIGEYDNPQGNQRFAELLAETLKASFGWGVTADHIAITNGSQSSFGLLFNSLAGPFADGQFKKILLPLTPEYVGYTDVGLQTEDIFDGRRAIIQQLDHNRFKYHIDFDALNIDESHGAVCVSRPTNPTGNVITDGELDRLRQLARRADIPLIIDGAYGLPFPGMIFCDATPVWDEHIILCLSLSKLGLPGLRTGIVVANPAVCHLIRNANAINSLAPGGIGPTLAAALLQNGQLMRLCNDEIRPFYQRKASHALALIDTHMADIPVRVHQAEGALFLWVWFEDLPVTTNALYELLVARGVYIIPGHHFYPGVDDDWAHRHQCIRVNYAAADEEVEQGVQIIADVVKSMYRASRP